MSATQPKMPAPGRTTISAPAKPPATSARRSGDTFSCRKSAASTVTSTGDSMPTAVNSATGMLRMPMKSSALVASSSVPRKSWKRGCAVRKRLLPPRSRRSASQPPISSACTA